MSEQYARMLREHRHTISSKRPREVTLTSKRDLQPLSPGAILQRAALASESLRPAEVIRLQHSLGNRAVGAMLARPVIQAKLTINAPGDEYEREADRVADEVMRMPGAQRQEMDEDEKPDGMTKPLASSIQRRVMDDEESEWEEPEVMTKPELARQANGGFEAGEEFAQQLRASQGQGEALPPHLRAEFEAKFGADFSGVRVHRDKQSAKMNRAIQARAFTHGQDIYLGARQYDTRGTEGKRLLAHELTHVIQQSGERAPRQDKQKRVVPAEAKATKLQRQENERQAVPPRISHAIGLRVQREFKAAEQFPGRSSNRRFGIGEEIDLSVNNVKATQFSGRLEWRKETGEGALSSTAPDGKARFIAGDLPGYVALRCYLKYTEQLVESAVFNIIPPTGGEMRQKPNTKLHHPKGMWGVAFLGELRLLPGDVSFHNLTMKEEECVAAETGSLTGKFDPTHHPGEEHGIGKPGISRWGPNLVLTDDNVSTGFKPASEMQPYAAGSFTWEIPMSYKLGSGRWQEMAEKGLHEVKAYDDGTAEIKKMGAGPFRASVTGEYEWYHEAHPERVITELERKIPVPVNESIYVKLLPPYLLKDLWDIAKDPAQPIADLDGLFAFVLKNRKHNLSAADVIRALEKAEGVPITDPIRNDIRRLSPEGLVFMLDKRFWADWWSDLNGMVAHALTL